MRNRVYSATQPIINSLENLSKEQLDELYAKYIPNFEASSVFDDDMPGAPSRLPHLKDTTSPKYEKDLPEHEKRRISSKLIP